MKSTVHNPKLEAPCVSTREELEALALENPQWQPKFRLDSHSVTGDETKYYLRENATYQAQYIYLSKELHHAIDATWAKRPAWKGSSYLNNVGAVPLATIIKRLGNSKFGETLAKAIKDNQDLDALLRRNANRHWVTKETEKFRSEIIANAAKDEAVINPVAKAILENALDTFLATLVDEKE